MTNPDLFTIFGAPVQVIFDDMGRLLAKIPNWRPLPYQWVLIYSYSPFSLHILFPKNLLPPNLLSKDNPPQDFRS